MHQLYEDIIAIRLESANLEVRDWALKCTATFGLLSSKLAQHAYHAFCKQFFCHQVKSIWITCIRAIFQLINRYGFDFLDDIADKKPLASANNSLLNVTPMAGQSLDDNIDVPCTNHEYVSATDILLLFNRYLGSIPDVDITSELVDGFCMLIVHGRYFEKEILVKLIVMFFSTDVEPIIIQIMSAFFETLIQHKKQKYFQLSVRETLTACVIDETFNENNLRSVLKFLSEAMMNEMSSITSECSHLHNELAATLLVWMDDQPTDSKSLNVISKEILSLRPLFKDEESKWSLIELIDNLVDQKKPKESERNLKLLRKTITQSICTEALLEFSSTRPADGVEENDAINSPDDDRDSEHEMDSNGKCNDITEVVENNNETGKSNSIDEAIRVRRKRNHQDKTVT